MDLSAVVVNWNSGTFLKHLLESLSVLRNELAQTVVVDNNSEDASFEVVDPDWARLIRFSSNRGFAAAANVAIAELDSSFILLLNPDVTVNEKSLRRLLERVEAEPEVAIICGRLVDTEGRGQEEFQIRDLPTWSSILRDVLFLDEILRLVRPRVGGVSAMENCRTVEQPAAAFWILRRKAWQDLGGFDEGFFPAWFEDVDFCKRLKENGWRILYCPESTATHRGALSVDRLGRYRFLQIYYGNLLKYIRKHHPYMYPFLWFPVKLGTWVRLMRAAR